jgi:glycosyltransferase involved in cell wall biosynthesis
MRILLINTSERTGGAAIAANRLLAALQKTGVVTVSMLVRDKQTNNPAVSSINTSWPTKKINFIRFVWERLIIFLSNKCSRKNLFKISIANTGTNITDHPLVKEADVIHLHWINQGFLSLSDIRKLIETGKPLVWTMHDFWPATGICHYPGECIRYKTECFQCPEQKIHPLTDLAKATFKKKQKLSLSRIVFVGCSKWLTASVRQSNLLKNASIVSIPNPIDTGIFQPVDKSKARKIFHLPLNKQLILFASAKLSDTRKGAMYLMESCKILQSRGVNSFEIVLTGNQSEELASNLSFPVHELGYISEEKSMAMLYSCVDLFLIPSLEDNLPNTIMEAMACGTPCVGFSTGGIPEMIDHKINGYLAAYKNAEDLATGIVWVLNNAEPQQMSEACIRKVQNMYAENVVAGQYTSLYKSLLNI